MSDELIEISKDAIATVSSGGLGDIAPPVRERFEKIDNILFGVITAVLVSLVAVVIGLIGLFLDQMRYNNVAYRDYADRIEISNELRRELNEYLEKSTAMLEVLTKPQDSPTDVGNQ